ncbi:MAG: UDP-N-acetylmuramoyl-L-alanine--D-glutamate ligase, partial [Bacillota bacterium]
IENYINNKKYKLKFDLNGHGKKTLNCDLLIVSPGVPLDIEFFEIAKKRNIEIISEIELAYQFTDAKIIAITGTNGKTTTTSLLGKIMKSYYGKKAKIAGNIGIPLISVAPELDSDNYIIAEISSFQLEAIKEFHPKISIFLNFSPDHLDRHKNKKNYLEAKKRIFENQEESDIALINIDDNIVYESSKNIKAKKYFISTNKVMKNGALVKNNKIYIINDNEKIEIVDSKEVNLVGKHNLLNIAFASLTAYITGVDIEVIRKNIKNFTADKHRLEVVLKKENGSLVIDDSKATNVDATLKALNTFSQDIILIAGGQDRNADFKKLAIKIREKVKSLILLGETSDKIKNEVLKKDFKNIYQVKDMKEAVKKAVLEFEEGDCLLLSPGCPSWDMYESYKERGNIFQKEIKMKF